MMYISMIYIIRKKSLHFGILFIILFFGLLPRQVSAQVVINEVSPASNSEWVELFNLSSSSASLKNYSINFGTDSQNKFFCDEEIIGQNAHKIINLTSHWLADSGDVVTLKNGDDVVDVIGYGSGYALGKPPSLGSISRLPDGGSNWVVLNSSSQQGDVISFECPTSAPVQTSAPSSTEVPTPATTKISTPTPIPTKTPLPTPVKTPLRTNSSTPIATVSAGISEVLGIRAGPSSSPSAGIEALPEKKADFPLLPIILIFAGVCFVAIPIFSIIKDGKKDYTDENEKQSSDTS